jgi:CubicO group peptidase (beta-lactamase class C family)
MLIDGQESDMTRRSSMRVLAFFLACILFRFGASAGDGTLQTSGKKFEVIQLLETWFESVIDYDRIPGISLAIVHDQELVYAKGFGHTDDEQKVRATPGTIYGICSITKIFTAIAVMRLRDAGKLSMDDPVLSYLPWFAPEMVNSDDQPPSLRHLLRHSSGLPCEPDKTIWSDPDRVFPTRNELIERLKSLKMSYATNTEFNYSNLGYTLLGEIVSVVSGMEYINYVQQNILGPLGMKKTTPYMPEELRGSKMAIGYGRWPRKGSRVEIINSDWKSMIPAGGYASTVENLARFAMWQFRVLDGKDDVVLSRETLSEMQDTAWVNPPWGLGFALWYFDDDVIVGHYGGCSGYKSQIILCPETKVAVAVVINAKDAPQWSLPFIAYRIMAPALLNPGGEKEISGEWAKYIGYYTADNAWSDAEVFQWNDSLAMMWVPTEDPLNSITMLARIEGNIFRQVGNNSELGKHYIFGTDADGEVTMMRFNNNQLEKSAR